MIILSEGMFESVTDPTDSPFLLSERQERHISLVLAPRAGWYNHYGQVLGQGDLALRDFENIMIALTQLEITYWSSAAPFIVLEPSKNEASQYQTISQYELVQRCSFVITSACVYSFDILAPTLADLFEKNNANFVAGRRSDIYQILGEYLIH